MTSTENLLRQCLAQSASRYELWIHFLNLAQVKDMVEVGVYRGGFAARILAECDGIQKYYMIDPWRHLEDWNKPFNISNEVLEGYLAETKAKTDFAAAKRVILRGKTTEVVGQIPDGELDFAYIDGDHTLRGVAIDLVRIFPKVKVGGWIGGDDFQRSVWHQSTRFEPTLVFPFAVYFAEAAGARIYALPYAQFLIEKCAGCAFAFLDFTGKYGDTGLRRQFSLGRLLALKLRDTFHFLKPIARKVKKSVIRNR